MPAMRVKVEFYDTLRQLTGCHEWAPDLAQGATVAELWELARRVFPQLDKFSGAPVFTAGLDYIEPTHVIRGGETISILPALP